MTIFQQVVTIGLCAVGTMFTRFLPFAVFSGKKPTPKYIEYLGKALPGAVFGMLVMYCLRNVNFTVQSYGIPELLSVAVTGRCTFGRKICFCPLRRERPFTWFLLILFFKNDGSAESFVSKPLCGAFFVDKERL